MQLSYKLVNESVGEPNVTVKNQKYSFFFPCSTNNVCSEYEVIFSPGVYTIELLGASGGHEPSHKISLYRDESGKGCTQQAYKGNVECVEDHSSMSGAGGYTKGTIRLNKPIKSFIAIGGSGVYGYKLKESVNNNCFKPENMMRGGYNGGGSSANYYTDTNYGTGSAGGATDLRMEENDYYHRVLVAGGGGGCDNMAGTYGAADDGSGGAGGNKVAQSFFIDGKHGSKQATQTSGFSFGNGEAANKSYSSYDVAGAGGGWFGGYSSYSGNGGGSGGSSFALTRDAEIPEGNIQVKDEFNNELSNKEYAFKDKNKYLFSLVSMSAGVWDGHGVAIITFRSLCTIPRRMTSQNLPLATIILCISY